MIWYSGTISVIVYSSLLVFYLIRRKRKCYDITAEEWNKFVNNAHVLLAGYFLHFLPFLFIERTLFLHHYLPAFIFKVLLTAATIDHLYHLIRYALGLHVYNNLQAIKNNELIFVVLFYFSSHRLRSPILFVLKCSIIAWILFIFYVFKKFSALSYGTSALSAKDVIKLRWKDTWDFIIHKT